ncbi:MAG: 23S rRNA (adenine(2503)-C(2))-methyltransferase RlmN [Bdellovibrionaceae bacterium]|nr:23S rRNA (adenine(2503)-C(2))-methyltransferase RlmN [Pseudobdellovibrionaceae bacterium]
MLETTTAVARPEINATIRQTTTQAPDVPPVNFYSLSMEDLKSYFKSLGKETFRSQQVFKWVYEQRVTDVEKMSNLSKAFRSELPKFLSFDLPPVIQHLKSVDGTQKFLFDVGRGMSVEAVLIPSADRLTLCISSEVGCNMACKFCYTGKQKLKRRLTAAEIVGQFMQVSDRLDEGQRISNIVFMGMGEPLDNCEAVFKSIEVLTNDWGMNLSRKRVTVSTSGVVPEMHRIWKAGVRLAVSLNASNDEIRDHVMPVNKRWNIEELFKACREYCRETGDKVTFEYVMLKNVTDRIEHARELHKLTRSVPCKINLIPFNEHPGSGFERPDDDQVMLFHQELMDLGSHVLLRRTMGRDIFAACGQLTDPKLRQDDKMDISNSNLGGKSVRNSSGGQPRV